MTDVPEHPPEPGPEAFAFARGLLSDLSTRLHSVREELMAGRFDTSITISAANWTAYCMILIGDNCAAAAELCEPRHVRVLTTIARTVYEYSIAQLYAERHPEVAQQQFSTFYGRSLRRIIDMNPGNIEAIAQLKEWENDASLSGAHTYSGNFKNKEAILEIEGTDKGGVSAYGLFYSNMSVFAHPDAAGFSDVFDFAFDDKTIHADFRDESTHHAYDAIYFIIMHAVRALNAAVAQLNLQIEIAELPLLEEFAYQLHFKRRSGPA